VAQSVLDRITGRFAATAADFDRSAEFPRANFDLLAEEGLIGLTVAREFGGGGAGLVESLRVLSAVGRGEPSTALILFMTYVSYAYTPRMQNWPPAIYERLARQAVAGGGLIGGLRVEPELGTPVRGGLPKTVARRTADGWALTGTKAAVGTRNSASVTPMAFNNCLRSVKNPGWLKSRGRLVPPRPRRPALVPLRHCP
jgi:alkylation response protein AidB-like acyl-CoA dehydrogenase